jgi:Ser-tRNA(Ala) deacylase AlaX
MQELGLPLEPAKAYHFPDGPYVEYVGNFAPADKDDLAKQIQAKAEQLIQQNIPVNVTVADSAGASELCGELPDYIDKSKPIRVVSIGDNRGCPCAGTHIKELGEIGALTISKIRSKGDRTRISYSL